MRLACVLFLRIHAKMRFRQIVRKLSNDGRYAYLRTVPSGIEFVRYEFNVKPVATVFGPRGRVGRFPLRAYKYRFACEIVFAPCLTPYIFVP